MLRPEFVVSITAEDLVEADIPSFVKDWDEMPKYHEHVKEHFQKLVEAKLSGDAKLTHQLTKDFQAYLEPFVEELEDAGVELEAIMGVYGTRSRGLSIIKAMIDDIATKTVHKGNIDSDKWSTKEVQGVLDSHMSKTLAKGYGASHFIQHTISAIDDILHDAAISFENNQKMAAVVKMINKTVTIAQHSDEEIADLQKPIERLVAFMPSWVKKDVGRILSSDMSGLSKRYGLETGIKHGIVDNLYNICYNFENLPYAQMEEKCSQIISDAIDSLDGAIAAELNDD